MQCAGRGSQRQVFRTGGECQMRNQHPAKRHGCFAPWALGVECFLRDEPTSPGWPCTDPTPQRSNESRLNAGAKTSPLISQCLGAFIVRNFDHPTMKTTAAMTAGFLGLSFAAFAQAPAKVTYNEHVLPIFRNSCTNCHNPDKKKAGLDLTTYQETMAGSENGPVLKPGNADGSLLYKVCTQSEDPKMPPKGDKLSDADLALLKNWIAGFALENPNSKPAQATQNKVDVAVVSLTKPDGPPPMPGDLPLEPFVRSRASNS